LCNAYRPYSVYDKHIIKRRKVIVHNAITQGHFEQTLYLTVLETRSFRDGYTGETKTLSRLRTSK